MFAADGLVMIRQYGAWPLAVPDETMPAVAVAVIVGDVPMNRPDSMTSACLLSVAVTAWDPESIATDTAAPLANPPRLSCASVVAAAVAWLLDPPLYSA